MMIIGVRKWALIVGASAIIVSGIVTYACKPGKPKACYEGAGIISIGHVVNCEPGNKISMTILNTDKVLVMCKCR